jgi:hypothetical protein
MDLYALLARDTFDPRTFSQRVFQQVQDRLAANGASTDASDGLPEELIATALGNWLAQILVNDHSSIELNASPLGDIKEELADYQELLNRNSILAAALGACDNCWGEQAHCPVCGGAGLPGWILPDEQLYASFVHPAVSAVTGSRNS